MITKYKTWPGYTQIMPCEFERETGAFLFCANGQKVSKRASECRSYHDTWEAARKSLISREEARIQAAEREKGLAEKRIATLRAMQDPEGVHAA